MSTEKTKKKGIGRVFWRLIKLTLILGVIIFILLSVLARLGGNGPVLREALEDVFSQNTGYKAKIYNLNYMSFFPSTGIDAENIEFYRVVEEGMPRGNAMITIDKIVVSFGFWDLLLSKNTIRNFLLQNAQIEAGGLLNAPINIESAAINEDAGNQAALRINGTIGESPAEIEVEFDNLGTPHNPQYSVKEERKVFAKLEDLNARAIIKNSAHGINAHNFVLNEGEQRIMSGEFNVVLLDNNSWKLGVEGVISRDNAPFVAQISSDNIDGKTKITGLIKADRAQQKELGEHGSLYKIAQKMVGILNPEMRNKPLEFNNVDMNIILDIAQIYDEDTLLPPSKDAAITIKDGMITFPKMQQTKSEESE